MQILGLNFNSCDLVPALTPLPPGSRGAPHGATCGSLPRLSPEPWFSIDATSPPEAVAPLMGLPAVVYRGSPQSLGSAFRPFGLHPHFRFQLFPLSLQFIWLSTLVTRLTALTARQAVPPCGLRLRRSLPRFSPEAWFYFSIFLRLPPSVHLALDPRRSSLDSVIPPSVRILVPHERTNHDVEVEEE